ncbi:hypothetical protein [Brevibacillus sp. NRS-1366]|uniref:hypothetical protein n=1 Tax=Brevibacillus sp. NRS-1366 TaxID=3233899 RepID=UPI003D1D4C47
MKYQSGVFVKMEGCPIKKENGVFEIDRLWDSNDNPNNSAFVYKLKKNGERVKGVKNSLNIFKLSHMDKYGTIISKEELSSAVSEVNKSLKITKENETVYMYQESERKELQKGDFIKVVKPIRTMNSIYAIQPETIYTISACEGQSANKYVLKRIGKKGQVLSGNSGTFNIISFSAKTIEKLLVEGYIVIVDQAQQTRKETDTKQPEEKASASQDNATEEQQEVVVTVDDQETQKVGSVAVKLNDDLNGIEIRFTDKPAQEVIENLSANGFRWSKRGFWYAKQSEKTLSFAQSLTGNTTPTDQIESTHQAFEYPEIDIDDLDQYTVSEELQRRLHSSSMFEVDYKNDCTLTFQQFQNEAIEVLSITDDPRMTYHIKKYLQSFKKRYYKQYIKILNHKANNPSWVVTGRGGLNARRYNKMQERYDKYLGESVTLTKEYNCKIQSFKRTIQDMKQKKWKEKVKTSLSSTDLKDVFTIAKKPVTVAGYTETVRTYNYKGYSIAKSWGMFRIFKNGKEINTTLKTKDTLETAKRYVLMLCEEESA